MRDRLGAAAIGHHCRTAAEGEGDGGGGGGSGCTLTIMNAGHTFALPRTRLGSRATTLRLLSGSMASGDRGGAPSSRHAP